MHAASVLKVSMEFHSGFPSPRSSDQSTHTTISRTYRQRIRFALPLVELIYQPRAYPQSCGWRKLREVMHVENRYFQRGSIVAWGSTCNARVPPRTLPDQR